MKKVSLKKFQQMAITRAEKISEKMGWSRRESYFMAVAELEKEYEVKES